MPTTKRLDDPRTDGATAEEELARADAKRRRDFALLVEGANGESAAQSPRLDGKSDHRARFTEALKTQGEAAQRRADRK